MDPTLVATYYGQLINDLDTKSDSDVGADMNNVFSDPAEIESFFSGLSSTQQSDLHTRLSGGRFDSILNTMSSSDKAAWLSYYADLLSKNLVTPVSES